MKKLLLFCFSLLTFHLSYSQETFPVNGAWDIRPGAYAFTNATIVTSADASIKDGTLLVKDRVIEAVGADVKVPKGYVVVDLKGKFIYPGLIDAYTTYGMPEAPDRLSLLVVSAVAVHLCRYQPNPVLMAGMRPLNPK